MLRYHIYASFILLLSSFNIAQADFSAGKELIDKGAIAQGILEWERSAHEGDLKSQVALSEIYFAGKDVKRSLVDSLEWSKKAAKQGHSKSIHRIGVIHYEKKMFKSSIIWWKAGASVKFAPSMYRLGKAYEFGFGVPQDYKKAMEWFLKAADASHDEAETAIGTLHAKGLGVKKNGIEAIRWWKIAAEKNNEYAQFQLGNAYEKGDGVKKDGRLAAKWYAKSARLGSRLSAYRLGQIYLSRENSVMNEKQALKWFTLSAKQNYPDAHFALAQMYETGRGTPINLKQAKIEYNLAAKLGYKGAKSKSEELTKNIANDIQKLAQIGQDGFPPAGQTVTYKGITLVGSSYSDVESKPFFDTVKTAINMIEKLDSDLQFYLTYIDKVIYDPPSKFRGKRGVERNIVGVYTIGKDFDKPGPIVVYKDMYYSAPFNVASSLIGNGRLSKNHRRAIYLKKSIDKMPLDPKGDQLDKRNKYQKELGYLLSLITHSNQENMRLDECKGLQLRLKLMKALKLSSDKIDAQVSQINSHNCYE